MHLKIITILFASFLFSGIQAQKKKNILLLCIDDLRPELKSFGADYIVSPNIDKLAANGRSFYNHYVNSPSCGPSRYTMLTGTYGVAGNNAIFERARRMNQKEGNINLSMPEWFKNNGYTTVSLGKVSHHPGGLGGENWNDPNVVEMPNAWDKSLIPIAEWQHPRGIMHGLAHGEIRKKAKDMDVFQAVDGEDTIYPDGHITNQAINQLDELSKSKKPFFFAVGIIKPHLPFGAPKKYLDMYENITIPKIPHPEKPQGISTWHKSGEFMRYNRWGKDPRTDEVFAQKVRKHYAACVTYADAQVGKILKKLKETGQYENTIIVLWGDHGWNLGDHNIWGKHNLFEEGIHSPLIISYSDIEKRGKGTNAIVETVDMFPTLCDLADLPIPDFADGISLKPLLQNPKAKGHVAYAYKNGAETIRTDRYRFTVFKKGDKELYDHQKDPYEINNIATSSPKMVKKLTRLLEEKKLKK